MLLQEQAPRRTRREEDDALLARQWQIELDKRQLDRDWAEAKEEQEEWVRACKYARMEEQRGSRQPQPWDYGSAPMQPHYLGGAWQQPAMGNGRRGPPPGFEAAQPYSYSMQRAGPSHGLWDDRAGASRDREVLREVRDDRELGPVGWGAQAGANYYGDGLQGSHKAVDRTATDIKKAYSALHGARGSEDFAAKIDGYAEIAREVISRGGPPVARAALVQFTAVCMTEWQDRQRGTQAAPVIALISNALPERMFLVSSLGEAVKEFAMRLFELQTRLLPLAQAQAQLVVPALFQQQQVATFQQQGATGRGAQNPPRVAVPGAPTRVCKDFMAKGVCSYNPCKYLHPEGVHTRRTTPSKAGFK